MAKVSYLRRCGFTPYIVFDGAELRVKKATDSKSEAQRSKDIAYVRDTLERKKPRVTHEKIVFSLIQTLKCNNVKCVVAPYEADAQLAFLLLENHVDVILTKDANITLYGCEKVIFDYKGDYCEYDSSRLEGSNVFKGFTKEMLSLACMLGGCGYLSTLPGVGLKRTIEVMRKKCKEMMACENDYKKVLMVLKTLKPKANENEFTDYIQRFTKVMHTYRHQRVYNPAHKTFVCLIPFPNQTETEEDQLYIGPLFTLPNATAEDFANGSIDPITKDRIEAKKHIEGGYVYSEVNLIGIEELQRNLEMGTLFKATSDLKVLQEAMFNKAQDHFFTQSRQISKDTKVFEACQNYEVEHDDNFLGQAKKKNKMAEEYNVRLHEGVIKPLNDLIDDPSLQDARDAAELYSRMRQEAEIQDKVKLENLKEKFQTSFKETHETLSSVIKVQRRKTFEILVCMSELESSYCKNVAALFTPKSL